MFQHFVTRFNSKIIALVGYPKVVPYTKFEHFGIIRFLIYAADRQTDAQTDADERLTPATIVGVSNKEVVIKAQFPSKRNRLRWQAANHG